MTTTTISIYDIQVAAMAALKADATLVADVGAAEIRAARWQGDSFVYPNVRLMMHDMPVGNTNGNCHGLWFDFSFSVYVETEGTSEKACLTIMRDVKRIFQNSYLESADIKTQLLDTTELAPIPMSQNQWQGEVVVSGEVKEKV